VWHQVVLTAFAVSLKTAQTTRCTDRLYLIARGTPGGNCASAGDVESSNRQWGCAADPRINGGARQNASRRIANHVVNRGSNTRHGKMVENTNMWTACGPGLNYRRQFRMGLLSDVLSASYFQRGCCKLAHGTYGKLMQQIEDIHVNSNLCGMPGPRMGRKRRNSNLNEGFLRRRMIDWRGGYRRDVHASEFNRRPCVVARGTAWHYILILCNLEVMV
jgi:hypothetical protein